MISAHVIRHGLANMDSHPNRPMVLPSPSCCLSVGETLTWRGTSQDRSVCNWPLAARVSTWSCGICSLTIPDSNHRFIGSTGLALFGGFAWIRVYYILPVLVIERDTGILCRLVELNISKFVEKYACLASRDYKP